ncbi:MAG: hypothetical protein ACYC0B_01950 [Gemmatimonadaceae bacterium]
MTTTTRQVLGSIATALIIAYAAFVLDWRWIYVVAGGAAQQALTVIGRALLASTRPSTKAERRLAAKVEQAVRERAAATQLGRLT